MTSQGSIVVVEPTTSEERNWGMAAHLSALVAIAGLPFGHVVGPLIVLLARGKESAFVAGHARASLNYQITLTLFAMVAVVVGVFVFGAAVVAAGLSAPHHNDTASGVVGIGVVALWSGLLLLVGALGVASLIFMIMGTIAANAGKPFTYPFAITFVR